MRSRTTGQLTPPPSEHAAFIYVQEVGAVSFPRFGCLHDSQQHVDTATHGVFLNLSSPGKEFRKKLTQYITMSVIPCPEGLILPDPIKSGIGRRRWYYFWTYSATNKGFQIRTSNHRGVLGSFPNTLTKTPGLSSREISCSQAQRFLLLQTTRKPEKGDRSPSGVLYYMKLLPSDSVSHMLRARWRVGDAGRWWGRLVWGDPFQPGGVATVTRRDSVLTKLRQRALGSAVPFFVVEFPRFLHKPCPRRRFEEQKNSHCFRCFNHSVLLPLLVKMWKHRWWGTGKSWKSLCPGNHFVAVPVKPAIMPCKYLLLYWKLNSESGRKQRKQGENREK